MQSLDWILCHMRALTMSGFWTCVGASDAKHHKQIASSTAFAQFERLGLRRTLSALNICTCATPQSGHCQSYHLALESSKRLPAPKGTIPACQMLPAGQFHFPKTNAGEICTTELEKSITERSKGPVQGKQNHGREDLGRNNLKQSSLPQHRKSGAS